MYNVLWIHFVPEHCKPTSCYCLLAAVCTLHDCIIVSNIDCWLRLEEKEYHQEQGWEREQKNGCIIFIFCIRQQAVTLWYRSKFQESSCSPSDSVDIELCIRWLRWKERCVVTCIRDINDASWKCLMHLWWVVVVIVLKMKVEEGRDWKVLLIFWYLGSPSYKAIRCPNCPIIQLDDIFWLAIVSSWSLSAVEWIVWVIIIGAEVSVMYQSTILLFMSVLGWAGPHVRASNEPLRCLKHNHGECPY